MLIRFLLFTLPEREGEGAFIVHHKLSNRGSRSSSPRGVYFFFVCSRSFVHRRNLQSIAHSLNQLINSIKFLRFVNNGSEGVSYEDSGLTEALHPQRLFINIALFYITAEERDFWCVIRIKLLCIKINRWKWWRRAAKHIHNIEWKIQFFFLSRVYVTRPIYKGLSVFVYLKKNEFDGVFSYAFVWIKAINTPSHFHSSCALLALLKVIGLMDIKKFFGLIYATRLCSFLFFNT